MTIPKNITREHILKAIEKIDSEGIPKGAESRFYDVVFNKKKYPPKLIVSYSNLFANGEILNRDSFRGGDLTESFKLLRENNFEILKKKEGEKTMSFWIEKTLVAGREDRISGERSLGKALWSPQKSKSGADVYKNILLVKPGDIVIHLIDNKNFVGVSIVKTEAAEVDGLEGTDWNVPSYLVELENYTELIPSIDRNLVLSNQFAMDLQRISDSSEVFYTEKLDLRQGAYLTPCPIELVGIISKAYKQLSGKDLPYYDEFTIGDGNTETTYSFNAKYLNTYVSIKTKPFIILAGLSGTGKSRLVRTLAYQFNNIVSDRLSIKNIPSNFQLVKVKPNWHDSSELIGYESRISGKDRFITTDFIRFIVKAWEHPETPFFLCLDEMNLAPVEQYFAEYLSVIETRRWNGHLIETDYLISPKLVSRYADKASGVDPNYELWEDLELTDTTLQQQFKSTGISLPPNLIVMGTVNMDETTHSFSRKVLDRAMTIEMNDINLSEGISVGTDDWSYPSNPLPMSLVISEKIKTIEIYTLLGSFGGDIITYLEEVNSKLEGSPFKIAYRVRDEFLLYAFNYSLLPDKPANWLETVLDEMTLMKILPRIEGDEERTALLDDLIQTFKSRNLTQSLSKANEMANRRNIFHYTSFWI